ncbi:hypothetical protein R4J17_00855 [Brachyspira intermedia]|uniref:hypothetical protein n=1 Tax=Brachyspira intermedia TaxID=84377 RepID=UPI003004067F
MKKIILIISILSVFAVACGNKATGPATGSKPLTTNVPSEDKTVKDGTPLASWNGNSQSITVNASVAGNQTAATQDGYNLLERLYSTTWYQSEEERDDGRLETEETFIFFDPSSKMVQREYENGIPDNKDEYSALQFVTDITIPNAQLNKDRNACIVKNIEKEGNGVDTEFEGYYLYNETTLYIVDGDNEQQVKDKLTSLVANPTRYVEERFVLSTEALN